MYRSKGLWSILNTSYITGLGMSKVCTEAVGSVVFEIRIRLYVWAYVKYISKQWMPQYFKHGLYNIFGHM